jgi:hypothetical protein
MPVCTIVILREAKRSRRIHAAVDEDAPHGFCDFARNDAGESRAVIN